MCCEEVKQKIKYYILSKFVEHTNNTTRNFNISCFGLKKYVE